MTGLVYKIGFVTDNYPVTSAEQSSVPGGVGTYTKVVAEELARLGHDVHVFTPGPVRRHVQFEHHGVSVWECPVWGKRREMTLCQALKFTFLHNNNAYMLARFTIGQAAKNASRARKFDVIESIDAGALGELANDSNITKRYTVRLHSTTKYPGLIRSGETDVEMLSETGGRIEESPFFDIEHQHYLDADVLTAPTQYSLDRVEAYWGHAFDHVKIVPNPIAYPDTELCRQGSTSQSAVLFGRFVYHKGIDLFVDSLERVREHVPEFFGVIMGHDLPFNGYASFSEFAKEKVLGGDPNGMLSILPTQRPPELIDTIRQHSICVLPSRDETFGLTFVEAMSWGMPCVVSDIPPFKEIAGGVPCCLMFENENVEDLADKMILLLKDEKLREELGRVAREHSKKWDVKNIVPELLNAWFE